MKHAGAPTSYWWIWRPLLASLSNKVPVQYVETFQTSLPIFEYLIEYAVVIMSAEYPTNQTISTSAVLWAFWMVTTAAPGEAISRQADSG